LGPSLFRTNPLTFPLVFEDETLKSGGKDACVLYFQIKAHKKWTATDGKNGFAAGDPF
jgi:hypothetical protein